MAVANEREKEGRSAASGRSSNKGQSTAAARRRNGAAPRGKSAAQSGSGGATRKRSNATANKRSNPTANKRSAATAGKRSTSRASRTGRGGSSRTGRRGSGSQAKAATAPSGQATGSTGRNGTLKAAGISALSATIGVAGGVLLGRKAVRPERKVLGVPVPSKIEFGDVGQQIAEAGRQFGKLAGEVRAVRTKAEQIGRVLS